METRLGKLNYSQLRNPYAPEAWIPSGMASILRFHHCLAIGCMSVYLWDVLQSLPDDYVVVFKRKFSFQTIVFLAIRITTFLFFLSTAFYLMTDLDNCLPWGKINATAYIATHCSITLLFYFRVSAVYLHNPYIVNFFRFCWLGAVSGTVIGPLGVIYTHIKPTRTCVINVQRSKETQTQTQTQTAWYPLGAALAQTCFDLLVCVFITYKLSLANRWDALEIQSTNGSSTTGSGFVGIKRAKWGWLGWRRRTTMLSYRFMQDSQIYFLIIVCVKIPEIVCFCAFAKSSKGPQAQLMLAFPDTVVVSILATKIYRQLKLGQPGLLDGGHPTSTGTVGFQRMVSFKNSQSGGVDSGGDSAIVPKRDTLRLNGSSQSHSYPPVKH